MDGCAAHAPRDPRMPTSLPGLAADHASPPPLSKGGSTVSAYPTSPEEPSLAGVGVFPRPARRLPSIRDRDRSMLGHLTASMATNPLSGGAPPRKHPRMLPAGTREAMLDAVRTARDRMIVIWLSDLGMRI